MAASTTNAYGSYYATSEITGLGDAEASKYLERASFPDANVQITGTYGSATVVVEVSNDAQTWLTAKNYDGDSLSFTSGNQFELIRENSKYVRVRTSGGSGTDIDAIIHANQGNH